MVLEKSTDEDTDVVVSSEQPPIAVAIPFPSAPTDDEEAQATASAAQQEGISVIRGK